MHAFNKSRICYLVEDPLSFLQKYLEQKKKLNFYPKTAFILRVLYPIEERKKGD